MTASDGMTLLEEHTQLEVQWAYSGHLVHLQWGTVHALHAIYSGHTYVKRICTARTVGTLYCFIVGLQCALQRTVRPLHFELGICGRITVSMATCFFLFVAWILDSTIRLSKLNMALFSDM